METRVWPTFPDTCNSSATLAEVSQTTAADSTERTAPLGSPATIQEALRGAEGRTRQMGNPHTRSRPCSPRPRQRYRPGSARIQGLVGRKTVAAAP